MVKIQQILLIRKNEPEDAIFQEHHHYVHGMDIEGKTAGSMCAIERAFDDEEEAEEEESPFGGPKPIVPYTSMFFLSPTNP